MYCKGNWVPIFCGFTIEGLLGLWGSESTLYGIIQFLIEWYLLAPNPKEIAIKFTSMKGSVFLSCSVIDFCPIEMDTVLKECSQTNQHEKKHDYSHYFSFPLSMKNNEETTDQPVAPFARTRLVMTPSYYPLSSQHQANKQQERGNSTSSSPLLMHSTASVPVHQSIESNATSSYDHRVLFSVDDETVLLLLPSKHTHQIELYESILNVLLWRVSSKTLAVCLTFRYWCWDLFRQHEVVIPTVCLWQTQESIGTNK